MRRLGVGLDPMRLTAQCMSQQRCCSSTRGGVAGRASIASRSAWDGWHTWHVTQGT